MNTSRTVFLSTLLVCGLWAAEGWGLDAPHGAEPDIQCSTCHGLHGAVYPTNLNQLCVYCHYDGGRGQPAGVPAPETHSYRTTSWGSTANGTWQLDCWSCHDPHQQEQDRAYGTGYGKYLKVDLAGPVKDIGSTQPGPYYWPVNGILRTLPHTDVRFTGPDEFVDSPADGDPADDLCQACHQSTKFYNTGPSLDVHAQSWEPYSTVLYPETQPGGTCTDCHTHAQGFAADGPCNSCHRAPPDSASHLVHAGSADPPTEYGSLEPRTNATSYGLNCGHCHPLDPSKHRNGFVEVELYDASAPYDVPSDPLAEGDRRAIKKASSGAHYTPGTNTFVDADSGLEYSDGTCSEVYCHSEQLEAAPYVPDPVVVDFATFVWEAVDPFIDPALQNCCNNTTDTYADFDLTVTRQYRDVTWGAAPLQADDPARCGLCHGYPPRNLGSDRGVGDSHGFVDAQGWESGHNWNHGRFPIQCRRCHAEAVSDYLPVEANPYSSANSSYFWDEPAGDLLVYAAPMDIDSTVHVNGKKDVDLDLSDPTCDLGSPDPNLPYTSNSVGVRCVLQATYDPATKSCADVECHSYAAPIPSSSLHQDTVAWGAPFGPWGSVECDSCHQAGERPHTATPGSDWVELFEWHDSTPGGYGVVVACTQCHSNELTTVHDNQCASCHPSPYDTLGTWDGTCQQGGCHVDYHEGSQWAHEEFDGTVPCSTCHKAGWVVPATVCAQCHATVSAGDSTPPVTTSDVQPTYVGPALIDFSITDNGKVGVGVTYYRIDGGPVQSGDPAFVEVVGSHVLEFWSVDQAGNLESPHNTANFTILADSTPPVTTSNAGTSYYSPANIRLTATDASAMGVKATYYTIDGGPTQTGTTVWVPQQFGVISHTVTFWSEDWSGNVETAHVVNFTITGGTVTLRLVWGDSDVTGIPPEAGAWADWTIHRGSFSGPIVASGSGASPGWSGVDDEVIPVSGTLHYIRVTWWDTTYGWDDQTDFAGVDVSVPGDLIRLSY